MNNEHCPCCPNNCHKDNLKCGRGHDYFSSDNSDSKLNNLEDEVIADLRRCGHMLHHHGELQIDNISEEELKTLHELLSKIL